MKAAELQERGMPALSAKTASPAAAAKGLILFRLCKLSGTLEGEMFISRRIILSTVANFDTIDGPGRFI